jgi:LacI family transcriptional regulator, galactose operon repressor
MLCEPGQKGGFGVEDSAQLGVQRPTMRDVAARAGVSLKTVSRVVNDVSTVAPELAERVRKAIDELGFHPNVGARILRSSNQHTASIGLLLEDQANPFCASVQRAVESLAVPRNVLVFSASTNEDPDRERAVAGAFAARRADGILLTPTYDNQSYLQDELRAGTAIVCIDREPTDLAVDTVIVTNAIGVREGMRHLVQGGHRRIAFIGGSLRIYTHRERHRGYCDGLAEFGFELDPALVGYEVRDEVTADGAVTLLVTCDNPPTAILSGNNQATIGAFRALRRLGLEHDIALVGFDDVPMADLVSPGITVIAQDPTKIGRLAAELLFARIAGENGPPVKRLLPTTLIRRGSGEITPRR